MWFGDRSEEAKKVFLESKDHLLLLLQERPRDRTCREKLASVYLSLGVLASWAGQNQQALLHEKEGIAIAKRLTQDYPTDQQILSTMNKLLGNTNLQPTWPQQRSKGSTRTVSRVIREASRAISNCNSIHPIVSGCSFPGQSCAICEWRSCWGGQFSTNRYRERIELLRNQSGKENIEDLRSLANAATLDYVICCLKKAAHPMRSKHSRNSIGMILFFSRKNLREIRRWCTQTCDI